MEYIIQQLSYNSNETISLYKDDSIAQSIFFYRNVKLDRIVINFPTKIIDLSNDIKIQCQIKNVYGASKLLNPDFPAIYASNWVDDNDLGGNTSFIFGDIFLLKGFYFFCFIANMRLENSLKISISTNGNFIGKMIKVENGTGVYRTDQSLYYKIRGEWRDGCDCENIIYEDPYVSSILRDGS